MGSRTLKAFGFGILTCALVRVVVACVGDDPGTKDAADGGGEAGSNAPPGSNPPPGGGDAAGPIAACKLDQDFGEPTAVSVPTGDAGEIPGVVNSLSSDELTLYLYGWRGIDGIYSATRSSLNDGFKEPTEVDGVNDHTDARIITRDAFITADGTKLYFTSNRDGNLAAGSSSRDNQFKIYVSTRPEGATFGEGQLLTAAVNDGFNGEIRRPWFSNNELWYMREDAPHVAKLKDAIFEAPVLVTELNSDSVERRVVLTENGLTVFVGSRRDADGTKGGDDIWTGTRPSLDGKFGTLTLLDSVNSDEFDAPVAISRDGCRLYLTRTVGTDGVQKLYVAKRPPL